MSRVKVGAKVRSTEGATVETVERVANIYGPAVVTEQGNVYLYGQYEIVEDAAGKAA